MLASKRLFFLGAGSMAEAMIKGLLSAELLPAQQITVSSRKRIERLEELHTSYGVRACEDKLAELAAADIIILAMKPFDLVAALEEVRAAISAPQLIISLAAGVSTDVISSCLPVPVPVIRAMPNTSSFVQIRNRNCTWTLGRYDASRSSAAPLLRYRYLSRGGGASNGRRYRTLWFWSSLLLLRF